MNLLWIHFFFREFTMVPFIFRVLTLNLLFLSRIHSQSIIFFPNQLSIHLFFLVITLNSLSLSRVRYGSIMFFANSLHYLYRDRSIIFFANSLLIYYLFARSLWILYLLREFTINFFTLLDEIITWYMVCIGQYMLFPGKASLFTQYVMITLLIVITWYFDESLSFRRVPIYAVTCCFRAKWIILSIT